MEEVGDPARGLERLTLAEAERPWRELEAEAGGIFATYDWASAWWRHVAPPGDLRVFVRRDTAGAPRALVALHLARRGPLRVARLAGHGPADELGPLAAPGHERLAGETLAGALEALRAAGERWQVFVGDELPVARAWSAPPGRVIRREPSPFADIAGTTWEDYLASRSRNMRKQIKAIERRLRRVGPEIRSATSASLDGDLDALVRLHRLRWGSESVAFAGAREPFHRAFAAVAHERGWLRLWTMEIDGAPVASWYGFRHRDEVLFYQSGRDPAHERLSVGLALMLHAIRCAIGEGAGRFRLLRGGEAYKFRLATGDAPVESLGVASGALGRAALEALLLARRLPLGARRAVRRAAEDA